MAPPSPVTVFLGVGIIVFLVGGVVAHYRLSVTRYHIPILVFSFLTVTSGLFGFVGAALISSDAEKNDYTAGPSNQGCTQSNEDNSTNSQYDDDRFGDTPVLEYSELSPEAQEVFRSALQADGEYTTKTDPGEFQYRTDASNGENYIKYDSDCYKLTAEQRGGFGTGFLIMYLLGFGIVSAVALTVVSAVSWAFNPFKLPTALLAGLGSVAGLVINGVTEFELLTGAPILITILSWIGLIMIERSMDESFHERMKS